MVITLDFDSSYLSSSLSRSTMLKFVKVLACLKKFSYICKIKLDMSKTLGQTRIGDFNPSGDEVVANIKQKAIELIDYIAENVTGVKPIPDSYLVDTSADRYKSLAFTDIESAAMWAVKAHMHKL